MKLTLETLPNDPKILKDVIIQYHHEMASLKEQISLLKAALFGRKSEKVPSDGSVIQPNFPGFEEDVVEEPEIEHIEIETHKRRKKRKKAFPDNLPVKETLIDISEEEKKCACGHAKAIIGQETHDLLEHVPAKNFINRIVRLKYACRYCEGTEDEGRTVAIAPVPAQIIPKSFASASLLAYILVSKFADALPFYRLSKMFQRTGVNLGRATMSNWTIRVANLLGPMLDEFQKIILGYSVINADETILQVLNEPNREAHQKSRMWVFTGGPPDKKTILFQYNESRSGSVAKDFLSSYSGYLQADGYSGYKWIDAEHNLTRAGCWAHARRKFFEAAKIAGKNAKKGASHIAIDMIRELYSIERKARDEQLSAGDIYKLRQQKAKPILLKLKKSLDGWKSALPPSSRAGIAVNYTINEWDALMVYLEDGRIPIDNNIAENAIRPFVVGRKNWLFNSTPSGARASATMYSIIETAKANKIDPYWYFRILLKKLPHINDNKDFIPLLPQNIDRNEIEELKIKSLQAVP